MEELFQRLKSCMIREVMPRYINMVEKGEVIADEVAKNRRNIAQSNRKSIKVQ